MSDRDLPLLRLIAEGKPYPEIAKQLHYSVHTVRQRASDMIRANGCKSRLELTVMAYKTGIIP